MARVFFAFPHRFDEEHPNYRVALREGCQHQRHEAIFASAVPSASHVLQHVHECIEECDAAFFDITGLNPSVLIEFGLAYAAGKPTFVLLNRDAHVQEARTMWGRQSATPLEIPADLSGIIRTHYTSTHDLRRSLNRTLEEFFPSRPEVLPLAKTIVQHLKRYGPLQMSGIASGVAEGLDKVRPVVLSLVAMDQVIKTGAGPGTRYAVGSNSKTTPTDKGRSPI